MISISKEYVLFVFAGLIGGVSLVLALMPSVPDRVTMLSSVFSIAGMSIIVFLLIGTIVLYRLLRNGFDTVDRSKIESEVIEGSTGVDSRTALGDLTVEYWKVLLWLEKTEGVQRRTAMYGNRIREHEEIPVEVTQVFDELSVTAVEAVMMSEGCSREKAIETVELGKWSDNRRVNAFLAAREGEGCEFRAWERLFAWVSPRTVFERNVEEVMLEVEGLCNEFLTFEKQGGGDGVGSENSNGIVWGEQ